MIVTYALDPAGITLINTEVLWMKGDELLITAL